MTGSDLRPTFIYDDGGRAAAGRAAARDCVTRGIALATGRAYMDVYRELAARQKTYAKASGYSRYHQSARNGVFPDVWKGWLRDHRWKFTVCRKVADLPREGVYLIDLPGHVACLDNWQLRDTWDCLSYRRGKRFRLVQLGGYWTPPAAAGSAFIANAAAKAAARQALLAIEALNANQQGQLALFAA